MNLGDFGIKEIKIKRRFNYDMKKGNSINLFLFNLTNLNIIYLLINNIILNIIIIF